MVLRNFLIMIVIAVLLVMASPLEAQSDFTCPGAYGPHFKIGDRGTVPVGDGPTSLYEEPNSLPEVGELSEGEQFTVMSGPVCVRGRDGNLVAWYVRSDSGETGWASEGYPSSRIPWIAPLDGSSAPTSSQSQPSNPAPAVPARGQVIGSCTPRDATEVNVRNAPDANSAVLGMIDWYDTLPLLGEQGDWYIVDYNGQQGYVSANWVEITYSPAGSNAMPDPYSFVCPSGNLTALLAIGDQGYPSVGEVYSTLRERPGGDEILRIPEGEMFTVLRGPECTSNGTMWFEVDYRGNVGWVSQGNNANGYWLTRAGRAPTVNTAPDFSRTLYVTDQRIYGDDVREVQLRLQELGFAPGDIDGYYGPITESAVRAFQQTFSLPVDGVVGPQTWQILFGSGSSGGTFVQFNAIDFLPANWRGDPQREAAFNTLVNIFWDSYRVQNGMESDMRIAQDTFGEQLLVEVLRYVPVPNPYDQFQSPILLDDLIRQFESQIPPQLYNSLYVNPNAPWRVDPLGATVKLVLHPSPVTLIQVLGYDQLLEQALLNATGNSLYLEVVRDIYEAMGEDYDAYALAEDVQKYYTLIADNPEYSAQAQALYNNLNNFANDYGIDLNQLQDWTNVENWQVPDDWQVPDWTDSNNWDDSEWVNPENWQVPDDWEIPSWEDSENWDFFGGNG